MKKALLIMTFLAGSAAAFAQDKPEPVWDRSLISDIITSCAVLIVVYLISAFILGLFRNYFDFRLKSKIVEKQTPEVTVSQLVEPEKRNIMPTVLQWFCTLLGVGIGFALMAATQPLGIHSLAIMAFSVAAGLGAYYFISKKAND